MIGNKLKFIEWKIEDRIGHIILNDPPSNQMTVDFIRGFVFLTSRVIKVEDVDVIVVYGEGRHFSSGANLDNLISEILNGSRENEKGNIELPELLQGVPKAFSFLENLDIPVIAAIRGICIGSGLELALACHIRVCGEGAILGSPESSFGLMPGCGGTLRLPRLIGYSKAIELILTGNTFSAEDAYEYRIVDKIVDKKEVISCAIALAKKFSSKDNNIYRWIRNFYKTDSILSV